MPSREGDEARVIGAAMAGDDGDAAFGEGKVDERTLGALALLGKLFTPRGS
jgi:hypothetical protein